jgi:integrase
LRSGVARHPPLLAGDIVSTIEHQTSHFDLLAGIGSRREPSMVSAKVFNSNPVGNYERVGSDIKSFRAALALANAGHDTRALQAWLGHKNIQHTVRYTELAPDRFKNFWRD